MAQINKLTPEQEGLIPMWREEFRAIGLSTERIASVEARDAIRGLYEVAGLQSPELVLIAQSPMQALLMRALLLRNTDVRDQLRGQFWDQLRGQLRGQLGDQLRGQFWDQLRGQLWGQLRGQLWGQLGGQLWGQLGDQLGDQLRGQFWGQLGGQLRGQLWGQLGDQLWGQLWDQLGDDAWLPLWMIGGWDSFWLAFYEAGRRVGAEYQDDTARHLNAYLRYSQTCGLAFCFPKIAFVCDRPTVIHFDEANLLHCETGPAVQWVDGYSMFAWHGTHVPAHWIENRETLDPNEVVKVENVEQRAAGAAIVGWPKMLSVLNAKTIDKHSNPEVGELIELTLPGLPEPGRFLKANCPRNGLIVEGVPRISEIDGLPIETAIAAQAWRIGDPASEFTIPPRRT